MISNQSNEKMRQRTIEVEMSSEAIDRRLREAGELNQLGLSLAEAKTCPPPIESTKPQGLDSGEFKVYDPNGNFVTVDQNGDGLADANELVLARQKQ